MGCAFVAGRNRVPNPAAGKTAFRTFGIIPYIVRDIRLIYRIGMSADRRRLAEQLFQKAYMLQMEGEFERAVEVFQESIDICPTAEAYTFLGWTYRFQGRLNDAIAECRKAIAVDPSFGNPYNDIGAYLIEQGKHEEAIPWLVKATESERYESYHYPWYNLGRAHVALEAYNRARECFTKALIIQPDYRLAEEALEKLRMLLQ